jgi:hypothetical protein
MLYALGVPDIVGPFDRKGQNFLWKEGAAAGNLFAKDDGTPMYSKVRDPQCNNTTYVVAYMATLCTLNALQDANGQVVLQAPLPGKRGTLGQNTFENIGTWTADMTMQKRVRLSESKSMTFRLDATNIFNHPTPSISGGFFAATAGAADLGLANAAVPFGALNNKGGQRRFQLKARLDF